MVVLDSLDTSSSAGSTANDGWLRPVASRGSPALAAFGRRSRLAAGRVPEVNRAQTSHRQRGERNSPVALEIHRNLVGRSTAFSSTALEASRSVLVLLIVELVASGQTPCQWRTSAVPLDRVSTVDGIEDDNGCFCEFVKEYKGRSDQKPRNQILGKFRREVKCVRRLNFRSGFGRVYEGENWS
ncbi:hypothetical protein STAS_04596 [Striga asiatica]|uniref:Uncharacterized protein n=1 Tax=Striga asiatica TaxID=4170 RepID=A0A5A7P7M8_STRAF|nr:hypothetical protein STAS_04596 [Striga asiatica]